MAAKYSDNNENQHNQRFSDIAGECCQMLMPMLGYEKQPLVSLEDAIEPIVSFVPEVKRMAFVAKKKCQKTPANGLTIDESASIILYSLDWPPQEECLYHVLNKILRAKNRNQLISPWFLYLKLILTALSRIPSSHQVVFRGVKCDISKNYPKGETIYWWGFSSCTATVEILQNEQFLGSSGKRTMFMIECFSGKDVRQHSDFQSEAEILLLPGRQFQVISCLPQGKDLYLIHLRETKPDYPLLESDSYNDAHGKINPNSTMTQTIIESFKRMAVNPNSIQSKTMGDSFENTKKSKCEESKQSMPTAKVWLNLLFHDADRQDIKKPDELPIDEKNDYPPKTIKNEILDRIQGSMFGMAIGDALGAHVEFRPHTYLEANPVTDLQGGGTWNLEKGQFTDDTSMALCLANSLIACHGFDPYDQLVRYKWWYRHGYMSSTGHCFDIGAATRQSIQEFETRQRRVAKEHGIPFDQMDTISDSDIFQQVDVYCSKDGVADNGALMRLAPLPLFFYQDHKLAVEYSGISGHITHGDTKAYDACRYYGALIVATLHNAKKDELLSKQFYDNHKEWFGDKVLHPDIMSIARGSYKKKGGYADGIRGKGYIVNALEAALWAFWSDDNSFETGALNAVNLGDDTDTTAAIYGQLAGAYYGYKKLPDKWLQSVYATKFMKCVSQWIAYEGEQWFKNQSAPDTTEPSVNSDPVDQNKPYNYTTLSNRGSHLKYNSRSMSFDSLKLNSMSVIERKAVDPSGRIGCFYDGCQDRVIKSAAINFNTHEAPLLVKCIVERGDNIECQNLLRFIGFDDELRLSVTANIVSPTGIASVVEYPYLIDESTRILYYSYLTRIDVLTGNLNDIEKNIQTLSSKSIATHLITKVHWGMDVIVILRLMPDTATTTDDALNKICECLTNGTELSKNISLNNVISTHTYSNIPQLNNQKSIIEICHAIYKIKNKTHDYPPLNYALQSNQRSNSDDNKNKVIFCPLKHGIARKIEEYLLQFSWINKMWTTILDDKVSKTYKIHLEEQLQEAEKQLKILNDQYINEKKRLKELIPNLRHYKNSEKINEYQILNQDIETKLKSSIDDFIYHLTSLKQKFNFIIDLKKRNFHYHNVSKLKIEQGDNENIIQRKLMANDQNYRILCSTDTLNNNNWSRLEEICSQILDETKLNPHLKLIYADFTYCSFELDNMKVFPSENYRQNPSGYKSLLGTKSETSNRYLSTNDQTVNILLLGRSGVGKSTLINTFINYLKFYNCENIQSITSPLHVLVAFVRLITGDTEEHLTLIGIADPNENYDDPDQSVTQQCKLYNFNFDNKKICIIDTPGFGKTDQQNDDDIIMQQILNRITNVTHLNAICVVLDSNDDKFESYQTCLTYLFQFLGNDASQNIIFCFTNELSKKINSDKRNNLIKVMLETLPAQNIRFDQDTIFNFDSTYFIDLTLARYFTSVFNPINPKCQQSWTISKNGWNRLLNYIKNLPPYSIQQGIHNIQYATTEIIQIIRPIMETIRNNFRNLILSKRCLNSFIELHSKPLLYPSAICYTCPRAYFRCGIFWIMSDSPHEYRNICSKCSCDSHQHTRINYRIEYQYLYNQPLPRLIHREDLLEMTVYLSYFLMNINLKRNNDLFLLSLNRMIDDERYICANTSSDGMNQALYNQLVYFKHDYEQLMNRIKQKNIPNDFDIYDFLEKVKQFPTIKKQIDAAIKIQETSTDIHS